MLLHIVLRRSHSLRAITSDKMQVRLNSQKLGYGAGLNDYFLTARLRGFRGELGDLGY